MVASRASALRIAVVLPIASVAAKTAATSADRRSGARRRTEDIGSSANERPKGKDR